MIHRQLFHSLLVTFFACTLFCGGAIAQDSGEEGFRPIFDGTSLEGWSGDEDFWRIEDGAIVGETTADKKIKKNIFLTWAQGDVDNFEVRLKFKVEGNGTANSGIQFRSELHEGGRLTGYQADIDQSGKFIGILYDEGGRGILCQRGDKNTIAEDGKKKTEKAADKTELLSKIDMEGWNDYSVKAVGNHLTMTINGHVMSEVIDDQKEGFDAFGKLGLQLHVGAPMKIFFKDIHLKRLPLSNGTKKVVFVAGKKSHGWGSHEHNAGCLLLANRLEAAATEAGLPVMTTVYQNGWPADPTAFDNADTIVSYCDGGKRHYLHAQGEGFDDVMRRGVGLCCIHYGVEVPKGPSGQRFLNWIGGYFETDWSVNPHWKAKFENLPDHPVMNGVKPFEMQDEWYYHMRFSDQMTRVTPLLSAMPPAETLSRKDGPHSGNPHVRESVLEKKQVQHLAWAFVRGDGKGRGFGFTGGHFHNNWQEDNFRKTVLNAIVWTAHLDVPENGVESKTPDTVEMEANQDYPKPDPNAPPKKRNNKKKKAAAK